MHNIPVTTKLVKKVLTNRDLSRVSAPEYIPVVVLKKCEPRPYILALLFNICLKESDFHIVRRSHLWSLYLTLLGERSMLNTSGVKPLKF